MVGGGLGCVFSQSRASVLGEVNCGCGVSDDSGSSDGVACGDAMVWLVAMGARQEQVFLHCLAIRRPFGMHGSTVREGGGEGGHKER